MSTTERTAHATSTSIAAGLATSLYFPNRLEITDERKGPAVNLAVWISFVTMCIVVIVKVSSKLLRNQRSVQISNLQLDDVFILGAMIFAFGEAVAVSRQVAAGIGQYRSTLTAGEYESFQKSIYVSEFLYIGAVAMAKCATSIFLLDLRKSLAHRMTISGTMIVIGIWAAVAWIGIAAQCSLSTRWDVLSAKCFDQPFFWAGIEAIDLGVDLFLVIFPALIILKLQISWTEKSVVLIAFVIRIITTPLIVVRLVYIFQAFNTSDRVFAEWRCAVVTQLTMNLSIIVACVPFLKTVINHLQPGWSTSNVRVGLGFKTIANLEANSRSGFAMGSVVRSD